MIGKALLGCRFLFLQGIEHVGVPRTSNWRLVVAKVGKQLSYPCQTKIGRTAWGKLPMISDAAAVLKNCNVRLSFIIHYLIFVPYAFSALCHLQLYYMAQFQPRSSAEPFVLSFLVRAEPRLTKCHALRLQQGLIFI